MPRLLFLCVLATLLFPGAGAASRAKMKKSALVCSDLADAKAALEMRKSARAPLEAFLVRVVGEHRCRLFVERGAIVLDEQKDGFSCVRPPGDLNCYWMPAAEVDEHPGYVTPAMRREREKRYGR